MKIRGRKRGLSGVLAAMMVLTCLPDHLMAEPLDEQEIQGFLTETDAGEEIFVMEEKEPLADGAIIQGTCGDDVSYELDADTGMLVLSGSGAMADYEMATDSPFYQYGDIITSVKVAEGITSIGALSFAFCFGIERVYLPNTLVSIEKQAFLGCVSLQALVVPEGVTSIGDYALGFYCNNGKEGAYQKTLLTIIGTSGSAAETYSQGQQLTFAAVDKFTHFCGENATWEVDLEGGALKISGAGAMSDYTASYYSGTRPEYDSYRTYITSVTIETGITAVGAAAFYNFDNLGQVEIADSVTAIKQSAFSGCSNLEGILLPDSLTSIGQSAFSDCFSLKNIIIPKEVTEIGANVFSGCSRLEKIETAEENTSFSSYQGVLFDKEQKMLIVFPKGLKASSFVVPDTLRSMRQSAFLGSSVPKNLIFEGDASSNFQIAYQNLNGFTIYYDSSKRNWSSVVGTLELMKVAAKDMSELINQNTLSIHAEAEQLNVGQSIQLTAQISPYLAAEFLWSSSNEKVVVVSGQGKVTAVNPGNVEIRVASADGAYTAKRALTVTGEQFSMPDYALEELKEGIINYTSVYRTTKQIVSEKLHGIYFLDGKKLGFYSGLGRADADRDSGRKYTDAGGNLSGIDAEE